MIARDLVWQPGDVVVTTALEHHSNPLPWRALEKYGVTLRIVGIRPDLTLDMDAFAAAMDDSVRLVVVTQASNVTGTIVPVAEIAVLCRRYGALLSVDAAQSVPYMPVDVRALDVRALGADFLSFSGHKMCGPTETGVLWMKEPILEPLFLGVGMVEHVTDDGFVPAEGFHRYEAGTPNIAGGIGLGEAAAYLDDEGGIMVRSGMHCAEPLMRQLGCPDGTIRASLAFYNTESEIDTLCRNRPGDAVMKTVLTLFVDCAGMFEGGAELPPQTCP